MDHSQSSDLLHRDLSLSERSRLHTPPLPVAALVILLPLGGALSALTLGRWVGTRGAISLTTGSVWATALVSATLLYEVSLSRSSISLHLGEWLPLSWVGGSASISIDPLTAAMLVTVSSISALVHTFSSSYMAGDPHLPRFFGTLSMFTLAMITLTVGDSILLLFAGWEGVGLCSYLLVSFWSTRVAASLAALRAFLMNRVGDLALFLLIVGVLATVGDTSLPTVLGVAPYLDGEMRTIAVILLIIGATAKSAQIGLHTWLPAAMEGPTPVSALIHAATMVTAGIYLLIRFSPMVELSETGLLTITVLGGITAIYGALSGVVDHDLKRVIAYSTVSQLGYMAVAIGLSAAPLALSHLVNHATFKALLFLSAGALLHAVGDEQDVRRLGGLAPLLPRISGAMLVGGLSLLAVPFMTGFHSKDPILEIGAMGGSLTARVAYLLTLGGACLTALYTVRLTAIATLLPPRGVRARATSIPAGDASGALALPLLVLGIASVLLGGVTRDGMIGGGSNLLGSAAFIHPDHLTLADAEWLPTWMRFLPLVPLAAFLLLLPSSRARGATAAAAPITLLMVTVDWSSLPVTLTDLALLAAPLYLANVLTLLVIALLLTAVLVGVLLLLAPAR